MLNILVFMVSSLLIFAACQSSSAPDTPAAMTTSTESVAVATATNVPLAPTATTTTPAPTKAVPTATATPEVLPTPTQPTQASRVIKVDSKFAEFNPSTIKVNPGEAVQFKVTGLDTNHTFTFEVDGKQVDLRFGRGEMVTSEVFAFPLQRAKRLLSGAPFQGTVALVWRER